MPSRLNGVGEMKYSGTWLVWKNARISDRPLRVARGSDAITTPIPSSHQCARVDGCVDPCRAIRSATAVSGWWRCGEASLVPPRRADSGRPSRSPAGRAASRGRRPEPRAGDHGSGRSYSSYSSCTSGYMVNERLISNETYPVRPETVLPDEPGHLG